MSRQLKSNLGMITTLIKQRNMLDQRAKFDPQAIFRLYPPVQDTNHEQKSEAAKDIAHNKIIIIDRATLITGSFNFTKTAEEKNAENLLAMKGNEPLVERYIRNFEEHKGHSEPYQGK